LTTEDKLYLSCVEINGGYADPTMRDRNKKIASLEAELQVEKERAFQAQLDTLRAISFMRACAYTKTVPSSKELKQYLKKSGDVYKKSRHLFLFV